MTDLFEFVRDDFLEESEARNLLSPIQEDLVGVWEDAWRAWREIGEGHRARLGETPYVPPVMIFGFAQSFARERFAGREAEGIVPCDAIPGVFSFYLNDSALLRFNTLGRDHLVRNIQRSPSKRRYFSQAPMLGITSATRLTAGYVPDESRTDIAQVCISLQYGETLIYSFPLDDGDLGALPIEGPVTHPSPQPVSESLRQTRPR